METFSLILTIIMLLVGLIGSVLPVIPGNILIGLSVLGYAWTGDFTNIGLGATLFIVVISLVGGTADIWMPLLGAKGGGASTAAILAGILGATAGFIVGFFFLGIGSLIGALIGYFLGIVLTEYSIVNDWGLAFRAGLTGVVSWGLTSVVQLIFAIVSLIIFFIAVF